MSEPRNKAVAQETVARFYEGVCAAVHRVDNRMPCVVGPTPYYKVWQLNGSMILRDGDGSPMKGIVYTFDFYDPWDFVTSDAEDGYSYPDECAARRTSPRRAPRCVSHTLRELNHHHHHRSYRLILHRPQVPLLGRLPRVGSALLPARWLPNHPRRPQLAPPPARRLPDRIESRGRRSGLLQPVGRQAVGDGGARPPRVRRGRRDAARQWRDSLGGVDVAELPEVKLGV